MNYLSQFGKGDFEVTGVTTINNARGCSRYKNRCKFCDMLLTPAFASPQRFWEDVKRAYKEVKANAFYEVFDSLSSFPHYLRRSKVLDLSKELGVYRLNMGLESFSNRTLKYMKSKNDSVEINYKALELAKEKGFQIYASFPLGSKAETPYTLEETLKGISRIVKEGLVYSVEAQPILPLPNNKLGKEMKEKGLWVVDPEFPEWSRDISKMSEVYIDNFSGVNYQDVLDAMNIIKDIVKKYGYNVLLGSGVTKKI